MEGNLFQGTIPSTFTSLRSDQILDLSRINLLGRIPEYLQAFKLLQILNLSNLGQYPNQLLVSSLSNLGLPHNSLLSPLLVEVGYLKNLGYLNVGENMLYGEIPDTLGSCVLLEILSMEGNLFQGTIPSTLDFLRGIQLLDLSRNNLSGRIPECIENFKFLQILNLSNNDFEGAVPIKGIFTNASAISVEGNSKLCGGIPELQLSKDKKISFFSFTKKITLESVFSNNATGGFSLENLIGVGSFGSVYRGTLEYGATIVAVKVLNLQRHGASKSFIAECKALRNIKHRNLVKVLTACSGVDYQEYAMGSKESTEGDVYSYGILLLEMFTGKRPTDDMFKDSLNLHNFVRLALPHQVADVADPMLFRGGEEETSTQYEYGNFSKYPYFIGDDAI
ncbi:putative receptor-like protein kinase At3g47110 [Camellia sinensis]|uniref:putative receptor-like protein kinase At3g47110 n=1 Tax=Camellia sinensis TaxID=4442 RepID=UPI0010365C58|nr:putative receptor-like protein kinase At3g47110 [Camellia sinensis]